MQAYDAKVHAGTVRTPGSGPKSDGLRSMLVEHNISRANKPDQQGLFNPPVAATATIFWVGASLQGLMTSEAPAAGLLPAVSRHMPTAWAGVRRPLLSTAHR